MNKKLLVVSILAVFMLTSVTFSSAINTNKIGKPLTRQLFQSCSTYDNITFVVKTNKKEYKLREPIHISLQLTNTGNEDITITTPSTRTHDFIVINFFWRKCYQWSKDKSFAALLTDITIPAGETYYWNETWNQKGSIFQNMPLIFCHQVRPGYYYIIGIIPQIDDYEEYFTCTRIHIGR